MGTTVVHNTAQNSSDNLPSYPPASSATIRANLLLLHHQIFMLYDRIFSFYFWSQTNSSCTHKQTQPLDVIITSITNWPAITISVHLHKFGIDFRVENDPSPSSKFCIWRNVDENWLPIFTQAVDNVRAKLQYHVKHIYQSVILQHINTVQQQYTVFYFYIITSIRNITFLSTPSNTSNLLHYINKTDCPLTSEMSFYE